MVVDSSMPSSKIEGLAAVAAGAAGRTVGAVRTGGANAYIRKPCLPGESVDTVNRLCS
jgi:hypothetical protein